MSVKIKNPIAQVAYSVAKGVKKNSAILIYNIVLHDNLTGDCVRHEFKRDIWLLDPSNADDFLVAQGVYRSSDIKAFIPTLCLSENREALPSDPFFTWKNQQATLKQLRPWKNLTGGLDVGNDYVEWNGSRFKIIRIEPTGFWYDEPSKYKVTLRLGE